MKHLPSPKALKLNVLKKGELADNINKLLPNRVQPNRPVLDPSLVMDVPSILKEQPRFPKVPFQIRKPMQLAYPGGPRLSLFLKALSDTYSSDDFSPGIHLAWLPDRQCFYGSIKQYEAGPEVKAVVCKTTGASPTEVVESLMRQWKDLMSPSEALQVFLQTS